MPVESSAVRAQGWTTLTMLRAQSQKAWDSGALLRELLEPGGVYPRRRPLRRPTAATLRSDYAAARAWAAWVCARAVFARSAGMPRHAVSVS